MSELIAEPDFAAETEALLKVLAGQPAKTLEEDRLELPDPALAGTVDERTDPRDLEIALPGRTLAARVYRPVDATGPVPVVLWMHGGGFIGGHLRDIEYATSGIAAAGKVVVVSLNYRLAPEHPYPAALDDVCESLSWLREHGSELGGDGRVVVGGQSAGAALAAGACLVARDNQAPMPDYQVLCYPCLEIHGKSDWAKYYYPNGEVPVSAVPLRAESLDGLPPALVLAAGRDYLRDDAVRYAQRLDARLVEYADTMHAFLNFPAALSAGRHAVELIGAQLRSWSE